MILEWSGNLFMFNRITLWSGWESQASSQQHSDLLIVPGQLPDSRGFFWLWHCVLKKAVLSSRSSLKGKCVHRVVHVITEMLKANSTNYYLADIQILFQTYHKGTISLRKSFFWLREFFSLSFNREKVCLDKIVRLGIRKKCLLKIIERFFC